MTNQPARAISVEVKALQEKQRAALSAVYAQWNKVMHENPAFSNEKGFTHPAVVAKRKDYDDTVTQLQEILGSQVHCCYVDCELWETFSDYMKSESGGRPRGVHYTRLEVQQQMAALQAIAA